MGFLDKVIVGGGAVVLGVAARHLYKEAQETERRRASPLRFTDGITESEFIQVAEDIGKRTPRVHHVAATGMTIRIYVKSNSGLSAWTAEIDFNDYGHLTGSYWISTENTDSLIPQHFATAMQGQIKNRLAGRDSARSVRT